MPAILIVTNRRDYTADYLILELERRGARYFRVNTEDLPSMTALNWRPSSQSAAYLDVYGERVMLGDVSSVWYRRPVASVPVPEMSDPIARAFAADETQAALEGVWRNLGCFWVSHPDRIRAAECKMHQLERAVSVGFAIPLTIVTSSPAEARAFYDRCQGRAVYKPLYSGRVARGDGLGLVYTTPVTPSAVDRFGLVRHAPVLLQEEIPKQIELRVTVIGTRTFAVAIDSQSCSQAAHDWRRAKDVPLSPCDLPEPVSCQCVRLVEELGLAFGALDIILTPGGEHVFLEVNPNGQWAWIQQLHPSVGMREALADLLCGQHG